MKFFSVRNKDVPVSFCDALLQGIAPDGGLYVPEFIPKLSTPFFNRIHEHSFHIIAEEVLFSYIADIPLNNLRSIIERAFNFSVPLVRLNENIFLLELFHGPTLAFKDIGARFMAESLSYFLQEEKKEITLLVATSGDTGSAVAHGFLNVPNINVFILYPSKKISRLQEQQMTTLGGNIHAIEVEGTFDDCQRLVKQSLIDQEISGKRTLTTANSINLGRLIPQITYYFWGITQYRQSGLYEDPAVVVPSGNFGNLTAATYAKWMGAPISRLIAATNENKVFPEYLERGEFIPRASVQTYSNAMDVGNPSNLARLQRLYDNDIVRFNNDMKAYSISDEETLEEIQKTYKKDDYVLDPHTAVGIAAAYRYKKQFKINNPIIVTATAHPAKFREVIEKAIGINIPLPLVLQKALGLPKRSTHIEPDYESLKRLIIQ